VENFWWVNDHRLLISMGEKSGLLERPQPTGELYAMNADGGGQDLLVGQRAVLDNKASHITTGKQQELVGADFLSLVPGEPNKVLVSVYDLQRSAGSNALTESSYARVEMMDVNSGHRSPVVRAPVRSADFLADPSGVVRFAVGSNAGEGEQTYYRDDAKAEWTLLNDEDKSGHALQPIGFSGDGHVAYLEQEETKGPNGIYALDVATHAMNLKLRDKVADPALYVFGTNHEVIGVEYDDAKPRTVFFDENSSQAKLYRSLEASFPDQALVIPGYANDGKLALVFTYSDRSPGDYYLFDTEAKKAVHLISHRDWIDPDRMAEERPITLTARDGVVLHGFLTIPNGSSGKNLPMVVNPHGGPFYVSDDWGFDGEVQLLASRGYAVLQVNFRGSRGYGKDFVRSGYNQWGEKMQDDLTDATKWAITQGVADSHRICIDGASYGGYAALMGVAKEPSLYRCAIGYVGIYDLHLWYDLDGSQSKARTKVMQDYLGQQNLDSASPTHLASRITVPVMLAGGAEDTVAVPANTERMRDALKAAGKSVDAKIYDGEGHGFFIEANREDFYTRMLAFLDRNIGNGPASPAPPASTH
jgi:dipeptidyl aminopeptidase/acylaminoacyl peptidase